MKTAAEYAELVESYIAHGADNPLKLPVDLAIAGVYAALAQAAATLEAARLMGPTPEDQARLDALEPEPSAYCTHAPGHEHEEPHYCLCGAEL